MLVSFAPTSEVSSIYALATNARGTLIASGSPEKVIRMWDVRAGKGRIAFGGHAENIRCILMSEDGKTVRAGASTCCKGTDLPLQLLSASADSTIKIWSTSMQRCVHTFTYHNESVWSLFSAHPNLDVFYSGDKTGLVCKVDMSNSGDISEAECIVICKDDESPYPHGGSDGITSIVAADDTYIWTATGSSTIQRWRDVPSRAQRTRRINIAQSDRATGLHQLGTSIESMPLLYTEASPLLDDPPRSSDRRGVSFADESSPPPLNRPFLSSLQTSSSKPSSIRAVDMPRRIETIAESSPVLSQTATMHVPSINSIPLESLVSFNPTYNGPRGESRP